MILKSSKNSMVTGHDIHSYLGLRSTDDCYGVYVGFQEINEQLAPTKVGRSKNAQAIQRGRAQGDHPRGGGFDRRRPGPARRSGRRAAPEEVRRGGTEERRK